MLNLSVYYCSNVSMVAAALAIEHSMLVIDHRYMYSYMRDGRCALFRMLGGGGRCIISCTCVYVLLDVVKLLIKITSFELNGV